MRLFDNLEHVDPELVKSLKTKLNENLERLSDECSLNHLVNNITDLEDDGLVSKFKHVYQEYAGRKTSERHNRILSDVCVPCTLFKFGLISETVLKNYSRHACSKIPAYSGDTIFNVGSFIHGRNPYRTSETSHPNTPKNHPSEKMAFPAGSLIIPDPKIMMQILALPHETICHGLKIIQINSDEKDVVNPDVYTRFFIRNKTLTNGYYQRYVTDSMSELNDSQVSEDKDKEVKTLLNVKRTRALLKKPDPTQYGESSRTVESDTGINYIPEVDDPSVFDEKNIFKNGEPLQYVTADVKIASDKIGMRIFDLNPTLIHYLRGMVNMQSNLQRKHLNENKNKDGQNYLSNWKSVPPIISFVFYDMITYSFLTEMNHERLLDVPPLNDKCLFSQHNMLVVNKNGDAIMVESNKGTDSMCNIFNKVLKNPEFPYSQRIISTASTKNVSTSGNPPKSVYNPNTAASAATGYANYMDKQDETKEKYHTLLEHHRNQSKTHHQTLRNHSDSLSNYFCELKDDVDKDIPIKDKETVFELAKNMYPQKVIDTVSNKRGVTLDYAYESKTKPVIDQELLPNTVYVSNLGFVNIANVCNNAPLILKNSVVFLQNLVSRNDKNHSFISRTSDSHWFNADDDDAGVTSHVNVDLDVIPKKRKTDFPDVVNLCGKSTDYDKSAFSQMTACSGSDSNINKFFEKYSTVPETKGCLRGVYPSTRIL